MKYVIAIDQGTTGTRSLLIDQHSKIVCSHYLEHLQIYPEAGWVEHDPMEIWENTLKTMNTVLVEAAQKQIPLDAIKALGIANQGETVMAWHKSTGKPYYNAIVWQCRRTVKSIETLKTSMPHVQSMIKEKTGLVLDAYFSASKIKWMIDNIAEIKNDMDKGEVLIGTLDSWLIWQLTAGKSFVTDISTAARTMLLNINTGKWDRDLLKLFDIPENVLANVCPTSYAFGETAPELFEGLTFPITGSMVDQPAALFGQGCFEPGMVKNTYGTGCFLYMNIGNVAKITESGILTTIAWQINDTITYAYDGGVYIAGAALQWLRDGIEIINDYSELDRLATSISDTGDVYFVPAFSGLAAPYWDQNARGTLVGITGSTKRAHIVRATMESIAFQVRDVVEAMDHASGLPIKTLRVDGGITKSDFIMQFQSDLLNIPIEKNKATESTALGVGYMAGLYAGIWNSVSEISEQIEFGKSYAPQSDNERIADKIHRWHNAVERSLSWHESMID